MAKCKTPGCGSYAINHHSHGRDGSDGDLCDVCYWRSRAAACADRDARIAELEREELEKEKQYVKEMTKDRDHWMTVAAERALLLDKNRKVNKPLSDYEFDEIG